MRVTEAAKRKKIARRKALRAGEVEPDTKGREEGSGTFTKERFLGQQKLFIQKFIENGGKTIAAEQAAGYAVPVPEHHNSKQVFRSIARNADVLLPALITENPMKAREDIAQELHTIGFGKATDPITHKSKIAALTLLSKVLGILEEGTKVQVNVGIANLPVDTAKQEDLEKKLEAIEKELILARTQKWTREGRPLPA